MMLDLSRMACIGENAKAAALAHAVAGYTGVCELFSAILGAGLSVEGQRDVFWGADPLSYAVLLVAGFALFCIIAGPLTGDYSWVDRIWSLLPAAYVWVFAIRAECDLRLVIMAIISSLWALRLTYNFARKGGYKLGHEDYRWPELRKRMSPAAFQVFNVFFISLFQNWLLLAFVSSAHVAFLARGTPLTLLDLAAAALFLTFFLIEVVADEQQWEFQTKKHATPVEERTGDHARGFYTRGLFRYSRHPNFFAEQALWWSFYVFSVAASGQVLNWSAFGPFVLSALFQGSTQFTEDLSLAKYPAYALYQQTTSRLMPWLPGASLDELERKHKKAQ